MVKRGGLPKRGCGDVMKEIHDAGADRHAAVWLDANQAAIHAARGCDFDYSTPEGKKLLSLVVLRVLDAASPSGERHP